MNEIGIAVEGESDKEILSEILKKLNIPADFILPPHSGGKTNMYGSLGKIVLGKMRDYKKRIVLVDYDNSKIWETKFKSKINELNNKPGTRGREIILHFARQEIESWLLGCYPKDVLKDVKTGEPDDVTKPYILIENFEKKKRNDKHFSYNKTADGKQISQRNELEHFRCSKSFRNFEGILTGN